jgi:Fe2+ transport system protein FeoA
MDTRLCREICNDMGIKEIDTDDDQVNELRSLGWLRGMRIRVLYNEPHSTANSSEQGTYRIPSR